VKKVLTILTIAFFATIGFTQTPDTARWVDGVWEVNKDPNAITTIDLTKGPNRVFNENTGDFYTLNPSDTTWSLLSRSEDLPKTYAIGDRIGDGYVFWIDTAFSTDGGMTGTHGLVCQDPRKIDTVIWDNTSTESAGGITFDGIYSGELNTMIIAAKAVSSNNIAFQAYSYSKAGGSLSNPIYPEDTYGNWYVPCQKEMDILLSAPIAFGGVVTPRPYGVINEGNMTYWLSQEQVPPEPGSGSFINPGSAAVVNVSSSLSGNTVTFNKSYDIEQKNTPNRVWFIRRF